MPYKAYLPTNITIYSNKSAQPDSYHLRVSTNMTNTTPVIMDNVEENPKLKDTVEKLKLKMKKMELLKKEMEEMIAFSTAPG